ncbi:MAG: MBL fold metallo-hydrolase [Solirubrobacteraceae bacterium]
MRITVLGKSPAWQDAGGACSGYLVEESGTCVLVDCGSGVFARLREVVDYVDVDAVVVSHMHADHFLDLIPFACALTYTPRQQPVAVAGWPGTDDPARPRLLVPPGATEVLRTVAAAGGQPSLLESAFRLSEYDLDETIAIGGVLVRFAPVPHYIATNAIEVASANGGGRFTFGADHGPTEALREFAAATDLLVMEATLPRPERSGRRGHLTPSEAGAHAAQCAAARLVLTHISDELDPEWAVAEARRAYAGPVEIARAGAVYTV